MSTCSLVFGLETLGSRPIIYAQKSPWTLSSSPLKVQVKRPNSTHNLKMLYRLRYLMLLIANFHLTLSKTTPLDIYPLRFNSFGNGNYLFYIHLNYRSS